MPRNSRSIGEALEAAFGDRLGQLSVAMPAKVTAWNRLTEVVAVDPLIRNQDGTARPPVPQCPVIFPGAYWDIQIGEVGMLLVCDTDFETWWRTGQASTPATRQSHRIGNSVFVAGLRPQTAPRTHATGVTVLDKPVALGEVRLGDPAAIKAVVHEDLLTDLNTFLSALGTWGSTDHVTWTIAAAAFLANVTPTIATITGKIGSGTYKSPSVKVEN